MDAVENRLPRAGCQRGVRQSGPHVRQKVHLEEGVGDLGLREGVLGVLGVDLLGGDLAQLGGLDALLLEAILQQVEGVLVEGRRYRVHNWAILNQLGQVLM